MNQITPYRLWVGHAGDGRAFQAVFDKGIKVIVQLALEEPPLQPPRELVYLRFPLLDGSGNDLNLLRPAINCVAILLKEGSPTLAFWRPVAQEHDNVCNPEPDFPGDSRPCPGTRSSIK